MEMTKEALRDICREHSLYRTPSLNDKLYCNFKGFISIGGLEEYTGLRALFLEGNAIDTLEGLPELKELKCLFAQQNCIAHIKGLERVPLLDTLNLSNNALQSLDGLECCEKMQTFIASHNYLSTAESIRAVAKCQNLTSLDLQENRIEDTGEEWCREIGAQERQQHTAECERRMTGKDNGFGDDCGEGCTGVALEVLRKLLGLRCLYLQGNPICGKVRNYRKTLICMLPELRYLDDRPVFEVDRRAALAWQEGGIEAERKARQACRDEERERARRNFESMLELRKAGWRERRRREGLPEGDTDPDLDALSDDEWVFEDDPPELKQAWKNLAAYTPKDSEEEPAELSAARTAPPPGNDTASEACSGTPATTVDVGVGP